MSKSLVDIIGNSKHVAIALDGSGGISPRMVDRFKDEIIQALTQNSVVSLDMWCFDTRVHNPIKINGSQTDQVRNYQMAGGGGTMLQCNWTHLAENALVPDVLIVLTDGYIADYPETKSKYGNYCRVVFGIIETELAAPFGETIFLNV